MINSHFLLKAPVLPASLCFCFLYLFRLDETHFLFRTHAAPDPVTRSRPVCCQLQWKQLKVSEGRFTTSLVNIGSLLLPHKVIETLSADVTLHDITACS